MGKKYKGFENYNPVLSKHIIFLLLTILIYIIFQHVFIKHNILFINDLTKKIHGNNNTSIDLYKFNHFRVFYSLSLVICGLSYHFFKKYYKKK